MLHLMMFPGARVQRIQAPVLLDRIYARNYNWDYSPNVKNIK